MTSPWRRLGDLGERLAAEYLEGLGHRVVATNARRCEGEIDLITVEEGTLVFVEVKLRGTSTYGGAISALSAAKQLRMAALAEAYCAEHPELPLQARGDLVAIDLGPAGEPPRVEHLRSAVEG